MRVGFAILFWYPSWCYRFFVIIFIPPGWGEVFCKLNWIVDFQFTIFLGWNFCNQFLSGGTPHLPRFRHGHEPQPHRERQPRRRCRFGGAAPIVFRFFPHSFRVSFFPTVYFPTLKFLSFYKPKTRYTANASAFLFVSCPKHATLPPPHRLWLHHTNPRFPWVHSWELAFALSMGTAQQPKSNLKPRGSGHSLSDNAPILSPHYYSSTLKLTFSLHHYLMHGFTQRIFCKCVHFSETPLNLKTVLMCTHLWKFE